MSSDARSVEEAWTDHSEIRQYRVNLSPENASRVLETSVRRAAQAGYGGQYNLLKNNCTTTAFDSLDAAIPPPPGVTPLRGNWLHADDETIQPALKALRARGMLPPNSRQQIEPMNNDVVCRELASVQPPRVNDSKPEVRCGFIHSTD